MQFFFSYLVVPTCHALAIHELATISTGMTFSFTPLTAFKVLKTPLAPYIKTH